MLNEISSQTNSAAMLTADQRLSQPQRADCRTILPRCGIGWPGRELPLDPAPSCPGDAGAANRIIETVVKAATVAIERLFAQLSTLIDKLISGIDGAQQPAAEASPLAAPQAPAPEQHGETAPPVPVGVRSSTLRGKGDFLWKPASEKDGNLVVLCPEHLTGQIAGITVISKDKKVIAKGKFSGVANGNREHYRFNQPGADFPANSVVQIEMKNGSIKTVRIKDPAARLAR